MPSYNRFGDSNIDNRNVGYTIAKLFPIIYLIFNISIGQAENNQQQNDSIDATIRTESLDEDFLVFIASMSIQQGISVDPLDMLNLDDLSDLDDAKKTPVQNIEITNPQMNELNTIMNIAKKEPLSNSVIEEKR